MPKAQRTKSRLRHSKSLDFPREVIVRPRCESCDKTLYSSKHEARMALTGQLRSKSIRMYPCPSVPGNYHVTKEWKTELN